jgi:hypothetical protein
MEKRTKEIKIRLTETEHQRLLERCDRTHLAEWLRQLGLGEHTSRKRLFLMLRPNCFDRSVVLAIT